MPGIKPGPLDCYTCALTNELQEVREISWPEISWVPSTIALLYSLISLISNWKKGQEASFEDRCQIYMMLLKFLVGELHNV